MLAPLIFPWPRSGPPTFFILESPLVSEALAVELCFFQLRVHIVVP